MRRDAFFIGHWSMNAIEHSTATGARRGGQDQPQRRDRMPCAAALGIGTFDSDAHEFLNAARSGAVMDPDPQVCGILEESGGQTP